MLPGQEQDGSDGDAQDERADRRKHGHADGPGRGLHAVDRAEGGPDAQAGRRATRRGRQGSLTHFGAKSTLGTSRAVAGASKYFHSSKLKIFAVMLAGN